MFMHSLMIKEQEFLVDLYLRKETRQGMKIIRNVSKVANQPREPTGAGLIISEEEAGPSNWSEVVFDAIENYLTRFQLENQIILTSILIRTLSIENLCIELITDGKQSFEISEKVYENKGKIDSLIKKVRRLQRAFIDIEYSLFQPTDQEMKKYRSKKAKKQDSPMDEDAPPEINPLDDSDDSEDENALADMRPKPPRFVNIDAWML